MARRPISWIDALSRRQEHDVGQGPKQRPGQRGRQPRDGVRPRFRLRPEHVAVRGAGVRGRLPDRPVRPRRRRPLRLSALRPTQICEPRRLCRRRGRDRPRARSEGRRVRRPFGQRDDRRAGLASRRPGCSSSLVLVGPSPRYIDDGDYVGGFSADADRGTARLPATTTTWAGRRRWRRRSWAIPTGPSLARS